MPRQSLAAWWDAHRQQKEPLFFDIDGGAYSSGFLDRDSDEAAALAAEREYDFTR
jgi:hypothetical protein